MHQNSSALFKKLIYTLFLACLRLNTEEHYDIKLSAKGIASLAHMPRIALEILSYFLNFVDTSCHQIKKYAHAMLPVFCNVPAQAEPSKQHWP